jgi:transglutaminase-like putative cysteine protease
MLAEAPVPDDVVVAYRLEQCFRYSYESVVHNVQQRLMVAPRAVHGSQARRSFSLTVQGGTSVSAIEVDRFGNDVHTVSVATVDSAVEFIATADVDIRETSGRAPVHRRMLRDRRYLAATELTRPDRCLARVGAHLARTSSGEELAARICSWTHSAIEYGYGATTVRTPAAEAAAGGRGVCQDFAHVMLAVCRSVGLPARYVSGHLVGEGGSHAWVEVLLADGPHANALAFDPTHDRPTTSRYVTVAVGRDYADVAPTSGTFDGACSSMLTSHKRLFLRQAEPTATSAQG